MTKSEELASFIERESEYEQVTQYDFYEDSGSDFYLMDGRLFGEKRELKVECHKVEHHTEITVEHRLENSETWKYYMYFEENF